MRLRHLHANRTATNNDQMIGLGAQIKDVFVCVIFDRIQPVDRRHKWARACGNNKATGLNDRIASLHLGFRDEASKFLNDGHAKAFEPLNAVQWCNRGNHVMHVVLGSHIVDRCNRVRDAVFRAMRHGMRLFGRSDQRFGRHAAIIQAIAAHLMAFKQYN